MDIQCGLFWKDQEEKNNFKLLKIFQVFLSGKNPCASQPCSYSKPGATQTIFRQAINVLNN